MTRRRIRCCLGLLLTALLAVPAVGSEVEKPNIILIVCDNLGYGDVGCYGSKVHRTPHIDRMAAEGMRFTDFYVTSGVCTPSRSSIMTGCYPRRVNMHQDETGRAVLPAVSRKGLHPDEITIAEVLKQQGYATAIIGKWHLGDQMPFLPTRQGFDYYLGIPYSDDMTAHPRRPTWPPLPLMENERVIEAPPDRNLLTKRYTEKAVEYMTAHKDRPFFLYLPQAMPGSTTAPFSSGAFRGKSAGGAWGDSVEELDWSTGQILAAVERLGIEEKTLVIWTNDNGAPRRNPPQGINLPLAGWGYTTDEGGMRVPCVMRWPGKIPAGATCSELCTTMDFLPTFARLAGAEPPQDRIIDGHDVWPLISGRPGARSPYEAFYYYYIEQLQAVRSGKWKLYLPLENKWRSLRGDTQPSPARLYDLVDDLAETTNLADEHPDVVARLTSLAEKARDDLGDLGRPGKNQRPAALVETATPRVAPPSTSARARWTPEQANAWYAERPWLVGCNFAPSTAINQLEMWQADTFDPKTIDRELGWAASIGFNSVRVFLHNLLWEQDREGFLNRVDQFVTIAENHGIGVMLVPLDGVWDPHPKLGKQREPRPHVHNSGWLQAPGAEILGDPKRHDELRPYIEGLIGRFRNDQRIHAWDLFNEPDNPNRNSYGEAGAQTELADKAEMAAMLLEKVFAWARNADPSQPLTAGVWRGDWSDHDKLDRAGRIMLEQSDVISFHSYSELAQVKPRVEQLRRYGRPILCTEYMSRGSGSRFDPVLAYFQQENIAAYNWGLVAGKTQTIYPWETWQKQYTAEPELWFHDIFRPDGTPYDPAEIEFIKGLTGR